MFGTILAWNAVTTLENGDPLPDGYLTGYRIYWGTSSGSLSAVMDVGPTPTQIAFASITGIPGGAEVGDWFAVSALGGWPESSLTTAQQWEGTGSVPTLHTIFFTV